MKPISARLARRQDLVAFPTAHGSTRQRYRLVAASVPHLFHFDVGDDMIVHGCNVALACSNGKGCHRMRGAGR